MFIETDTMDEETEARVKSLGSISISGSAAAEISEETVKEILTRFSRGDYGVVHSERAWANDKVMYLKDGNAWGLYELEDGTKIIVLTQYNQVITQIGVYGASDTAVFPDKIAVIYSHPPDEPGEDTEDFYRTKEILENDA